MIKKTAYAILLFCSIAVSAQQINWMTLEEATKAQKKEPRKIMMDVYTDWCGPCKLLDKRTFQNKDVIQYVNAHILCREVQCRGK